MKARDRHHWVEDLRDAIASRPGFQVTFPDEPTASARLLLRSLGVKVKIEPRGTREPS